jgi:hypothetical protein
MRSRISIATLVLLAVSAAPSCASGFDDKIPDQQSIDALAVKASHAQPREQCYLYAELVHEMTEYSLLQYEAGNVEKAAELLRQIQPLTRKIQLTVTDNGKKLKNAELLLRHTAFRLNEMLHTSSFEDRALVEQTLTQVNQAQTQAMMQVFRNP